MLLKRHFTMICIAAALYVSLSAQAFAKPPCEVVYQVRLTVENVLAETTDWKNVADKIVGATDPRLKIPLAIKADNGVPLPSDADSYRHARFVVSENPPVASAGAQERIATNAVVYYPSLGSTAYSEVKGRLQRIGTLKYVVLGSDSKVIEVGATSERVLQEFKAHLFGVEPEAGRFDKIYEINSKLFKFLRENPVARERALNFAESRHWPAGLIDELGIVYFDIDVLNLQEWAIANHYSLDDMVAAGWLQLRFNPAGEPHYIRTWNKTIKIPYFADAEQTKIISWRTRLTDSNKTATKYLSIPKDRRLIGTEPLASKLYNSWLLPQAKGKAVVITEGEFKAKVATYLSGTLHLGIPGITMVDDETIQAVIAAEPAKIIVILDRDAKAKAFNRFDEITDSERAAYRIARRIQMAGYRHVLVGTLPDVFAGNKVGADDLILEKGVELYQKTLSLAKSPEDYAASHDFEPVFQELLLRLQTLVGKIEHYNIALKRGGGGGEIAEALEKAKTYVAKLEAAFTDYVQKILGSDRTVGEPSVQFDYLPQKPFALRDMMFTVTSASNRKYYPRDFTNDIVLHEYVTADLAPESTNGYEKKYPFEYADILRAMNKGATQNQSLSLALSRGLQLAEESGFIPETTLDLLNIPLAGYLSYYYPESDYRFDFNVRVQIEKNGETLLSPIIPIIIQRKETNKITAIVNLRSTVQPKLSEWLKPYLRPQ